MQYISLPNHGLISQLWHRKATLLVGFLAIMSLSLAHYAGFLFEVPHQLVAVVGLPLASGVTATFLFYVFFCAVVARVLTAMIQLVTLPFLAAVDRLERGFGVKMDWAHQRRFVRSHKQTIKWEGFVWVLFQLALFLLLMMAIYVKFAATWFSSVGLFISMVLVVASGLFRAGYFLQPKPRVFIRKIKTRRANYGRLASASFVTVTAALVIAAFFIGAMRAQLLRNQSPQMIVSKEFKGNASVIASYGQALLLFQRQNANFRYIYSTPEFSASIESKAVFPPIGTKQGE